MKKYSKYFILAFCLIAILVSVCFIPISANNLIPTIEEQVSKDLGVNIHIEKLILRVGPLLKVKAPVMHMMYEDGQKFAQFDNVKFYIPWTSIIKKNPTVDTLYANKLIVRINSNDKYLNNFLDKLQKKNYEEIPNIHLKEYSIAYFNKENNDNYSIAGQALELNKVVGYKSIKINTLGAFSINNQKYITYDLAIHPKMDFQKNDMKIDVITFIEHLKELDFYSDIIADLKLYKSSDETVQASGFVNIDNISVLDTAKKNPKSFVYLTLWGDKASILSNIYTSPNKKVYIEGMVNNSKKPVLDLKVKTDEINLNNLYQKLRIFVDFSKFKDLTSVDGTLNANFTLKGDLNKIKSNGFLKVANANIKASGLQVDKINADIDFSNNTINIINAIGYVNNAPILAKGNIDKNVNIELVMNKVELKYLCPTVLGVKNGIASLVANLTGTLDNIVHKEILQIENLRIEKQSSSLAVDSLKIDTNKSNTAYINNITFKSPEIEPIRIPTLKLQIERDKITVPDANIYMPNSRLTAKSEITNYNNNDITFNMAINGYVNSKDIDKLKIYSTRYPLKLNINGNKNVQNINSQVLLEDTSILDEPAVINLVSKIEKNVLKIDDLSISPLEGKFSNDFKANLKGTKKLVITGIVEDFKKPILKNLRIFIPQQLCMHFCDTIIQLKGDIFVNGRFDKPEIVGQIGIQNLFNQPMQLALSNATLDFNKNNVIINAPLIKIGDSSMTVSGTASTDISKYILVKNVNVKSKYINTDTLLMYKDSPLMKLYPIEINEGKFFAERIQSSLYDSSIYMTAFSSDFKLSKELLSLKNIASEIFNGKLAGSLEYNLKDEHFNSKIMGRGVSAAPIFDIISTRNDQVSGVMDFDTALKGELTSKHSLNGDVKFIVHNGRMSSLGKLEHLLYAQNVIADNMLRTSLSVVTKAITLKDTGLFKYLRGDIQLDKGVANIKMLQSQGPLMALYMKGVYDPTTDYAKLSILGRLSDEVMSGLGAFGDFSLNKLMVMLTGEETKYNLIPEDFEKLPQLTAKNTKEFRAIINGNIDKPSSVALFNWISYSQKSLRQKEVPMSNVKLPSFVEDLPY